MRNQNVGFLKYLLFPVFAFFASGCIQEDPELSGFGDAFIRVEVSGTDTLYGLGLHAFSYTNFSSVEVTKAEKIYSLAPYLGLHQDFIYETPKEQLASIPPQDGDYIFNALYADGRTMNFTDRLFTSVARPVRITECRYNRDTDLAEIAWLVDKRNDAYNIKVFNSSGELLFVSRVYNNDSDYYAFGRNTQGWQTSNRPMAGQALLVEISAYLNQPETKGEKLQSIAFSRHSLIWFN